MSDQDSERYRAPALDKGLDILELLANTDGALSQSEIAKAIGRSPNEIFRMLDRLLRRGYLFRQEDDRFSLSLKLFSLSHIHAPLRRLCSFAQPHMKTLSQKAEQACNLAVYDRGAIAVIAQQDSPSYWALSIRIGAQLNLFTTGSGLVLLANQTQIMRQVMLEEENRVHGTDMPIGLHSTLDAIQAAGFHTMQSLQTLGVRNLSAPILNSDGNALAALTIPFIAPVSSQSPNEQTCIELLRGTAEEISKALSPH